MQQNSVKAICRNGDLLERHYFLDQPFKTDFQLYSEVWLKVVFPNQKEGSTSVTDRWDGFAAAHYTAIVRCWSAYKASIEIEDQVVQAIDNIDAEVITRLQRLMFEFYCSIGAAIDNLERAFKSLDGNHEPEFTKLKQKVPAEGKSLCDLFEIRHRMIHGGIVPCAASAGLITVDKAMLENIAATWYPQQPSHESVEVEIKADWVSFKSQMMSVWSKLLSICKEQGQGAANAISATPPDRLPTVDSCDVPVKIINPSGV